MLRLVPVLALLLGACLFDGKGEAEVRRPDAGVVDDAPDAGVRPPDAAPPGGNDDDGGPDDDDGQDDDEDDDGGGLLGGGAVCDDDEECESGACDSVGGGVKQCLEACRVDADCPAGFECDDGACDD